MGFYSFEAFYIAHAAMALLTWFPTVVLFFCTFCMVRRKRDPARTGFTYLKLAFPLFAAFLFFDVCAYACAVAYTRWWRDVGYSSSDYDENVLKSLTLAQAHTWAVARLFDCMADIVVFIVLERLATGVVIAKAGVPDKIGTVAKYASYGIAVLLAALNFAQFGLRERFNIEYYVGDFFDGTGYVDNTTGDTLTKSSQVEFSFQVLVFVLSLAIVGRSIMVKMQSRAEPRVTNASNFVLAASVLWLLRSVYNMAAIASLTNLSNALENSKERKNYWNITGVVFAIWPQFILLCLAFFLGLKKGNGLWSTEQPFMKVTSGQQQTPWGYGYDQQQPQYAPPVQQTGWQSQEQQQQQQQYQQDQQNQQYQQQYHQQQPAYAPQQHQNGYQQPYQDPQAVSSYSTTPVQTRSPPPPHEDTIGLNHQANGTPPQGPPQPYNEKAY